LDFAVIEGLHGASRLVALDAVRGGKKPRTISKYMLTPRKGDLSELPSLHGLALSDVLDLAASSGILTCLVVVIGVEPKDDSPGPGLSPEVETTLPSVIEALIKELGLAQQE
jgi:hydrogenase maturation protease